MVGVCSALALQADGHAVTLLDRRAPGHETSYGNAGLIQREAVEPYAFPDDPALLLPAALHRSTAVDYHSAALVEDAPQLLAYWRASRGDRYQRSADAYRALIEHCLDDHQALIDASGAGELIRRNGYLSLFRGSASFDEGAARAQRLAGLGVQSQVLDAQATRALEPVLADAVSRRQIVGAVHWQQTWSCREPGALVERYAALFRARGGTVVEDELLDARPTGAGWAVSARTQTLAAQHLVLALGPWAREFCLRLGLKLPLFVKRGYHRHYRFERTPERALLDADSGFVLAPMRAGVRLTTGAELARLGAPPTPRQLLRDEPLAQQLLGAAEPVEAAPWLGNRPCTVDMLPIISPAPLLRGLWLNFGHGHQGFTLGPTSARLLADLVADRAPRQDAALYSAERFDTALT